MPVESCNPAVRAGDATAVRKPLLRWYDRHRRTLPWRAAKGAAANPYHVLVSEAMLQQTQVATVIAYFERFVAAFPTVEALAAADEQHVLTLWQGLGYYRRARHLHAAAKMIVRDFAGVVPATVTQLLTLPGVGRYSAGAIASIAYNVPAPILDGNVARVLARLYAIDEPIDAPTTKTRLWSLAESLVTGPHQSFRGNVRGNFRGNFRGFRGGDFNQAMMELGALVCTPRQPRCLTCPLRETCATRSDARPIKNDRRAPKPVTHTVIAVRRGGRYLFEQRGTDGLWASMWQMPTAETRINPAAWIAERFNLAVTPPREVADFTHQTTHRTIRFHVLTADAVSGRLRPRAALWRALHDLHDLPLSNPQRSIVDTLST